MSFDRDSIKDRLANEASRRSDLLVLAETCDAGNQLRTITNNHSKIRDGVVMGKIMERCRMAATNARTKSKVSLKDISSYEDGVTEEDLMIRESDKSEPLWNPEVLALLQRNGLFIGPLERSETKIPMCYLQAGHYSEDARTNTIVEYHFDISWADPSINPASSTS